MTSEPSGTKPRRTRLWAIVCLAIILSFIAYLYIHMLDTRREKARFRLWSELHKLDQDIGSLSGRLEGREIALSGLQEIDRITEEYVGSDATNNQRAKVDPRTTDPEWLGIYNEIMRLQSIRDSVYQEYVRSLADSGSLW